jgi:leucyl aminopeptidase
MEFSVTTANPASKKAGVLVIGVFERRRLSDIGAAIDRAADGHLRGILANGDLAGETNTSLLLYDVPGVRARRVLLVGCGKANAFDRAAYRKVNAYVAGVLERSRATDALTCLPAIAVRGMDPADRARVAVEATESSRYRFDEFRNEPNAPKHPLTRLTLYASSRADKTGAESGIAHARSLAAGMHLARDLANRPANVCTPTHLAEQAHALDRQYDRVHASVLEESDMEELGMGAMLAVSRGSREPAKLITMSYQGAGADKAPVVFVGKGVTFDSGGISIKPAAAMDEMKFDMGGAASVFGLIRACAEMGIRANVVGLVPAAENMPDGAAYRPGDILKTMSGQTIEIINTDAEGRLLLCDTLTYAKRFSPDTIIDIATLTGACIVALGHHASAVLSTSDQLARQLMQAGERAGDRAWQLPLWDEYQEQLKSPFADFSHVGGQPAGTITAACFLSRFTKEYRRWGHLDIAGTAWTRGDQKGATGRPVPLMFQYLLDHHDGR